MDLGPQIGGQNRSFGHPTKCRVPFLGSGNWICFHKALQNLPRSILEPPGVDFGAPGSRFGGVRTDFWRYLPVIFLARSSSSIHQATRTTKTFRTSNRLPRNVKYRKGGGGAPPPWGDSITFPKKFPTFRKTCGFFRKMDIHRTYYI